LACLLPYLTADLLVAAYILAAAFAAGAMRGYSGFGFALAAVPLLTVPWPPCLAIPVVLVQEIVLSLALLPRIWSSIDRRSVFKLILGALIGTPVGVGVLSSLRPDLIRLGIGSLLLVFVWALWAPSRVQKPPSTLRALLAGTASGVLSGGTAMSGPPIIGYYLHHYSSADISRASMMAYFMASSAISIVIGGTSGVYESHFLFYAIALAPFAVAGSILGNRCFAIFPTSAYRRFTLIVLAGLGIYTLASESLSFH